MVVGKQSWKDARKTCRDAGGSIVQVDSKKEWNAVSLLANLMGKLGCSKFNK